MINSTTPEKAAYFYTDTEYLFNSIIWYISFVIVALTLIVFIVGMFAPKSLAGLEITMAVISPLI